MSGRNAKMLRRVAHALDAPLRAVKRRWRAGTADQRARTARLADRKSPGLRIARAKDMRRRWNATDAGDFYMLGDQWLADVSRRIHADEAGMRKRLAG